MTSKFAQKFNIAIRRAEEMINEERRHNEAQHMEAQHMEAQHMEAQHMEARHMEARHNEARKDLAFWQQQDLSHDYRETTSFEHELLNAITSRR